MPARRCTSEKCLLTASKNAYAFSVDFPVANILSDPRRDWEAVRSRGGRFRIASEVAGVDWEKYNTRDYLFTDCTLVCSVETEADGHTLTPPCNELINANGNAWTTPVLLATYKTFIGGFNFLEHNQNEAFSKGIILDAHIYPVTHKNDLGEAHIYYVNLLVATERIHTDIIDQIEAGKLRTLSMGCLCNYVQCSKCGKVFSDDTLRCDHLERHLGETYIDGTGKPRRIAELCGRSVIQNGQWVGDPDSVRFIEASWVAQPAFAGAIVNHFVETPLVHDQRKLYVSSKTASYSPEVVFGGPGLRVADANNGLALRVARKVWLKDKYETMLNSISDKVLRSLEK